jgi:riboflavin synthase
MFTGIIEATGTVASAAWREDVLVVRVDADTLASELPEGGSIAVNGCCLTAVAVDARGFIAELTRETLERTAFARRLVPGARVNLERPLRADGRFDGHIVQGHVDGVARVVELRRETLAAELTVSAPAALRRYLVEKGSVALDGVSLTVARLRPDDFTIALIPYTLQHTSLGSVQPGDGLNVEVDVVAKYVERLLAPHVGDA